VPRSTTAIVHAGRWSARLERTVDSQGSFNGLSKSIPLDVTGKTIVVRAFLRTADVTSFVALYTREDGDQPSLRFASTQGRGVNGTNDWQEHTVTVALRPEAKRLTGTSESLSSSRGGSQDALTDVEQAPPLFIFERTFVEQVTAW
jgi:hypothetical protein